MKHHHLLPLFASLTCLTAGLFLTHKNQSGIEANRIRDAELRASVFARKIDMELNRAIAATDLLKWTLYHHEGHVHDFDDMAQQIINSAPVVTNLQLSPNGIVSEIYPLEGHEAALGHNILKDDARKGEAIAGINANQPALAGPFQLLQGGVGMVIRNPVFFDQDDGTAFWGFTSALIMLDNLLAQAQLTDAGTTTRLSRFDAYTGNWEIFHQSTNATDGPMANLTLDVLNGTWRVGVAYLPLTLWDYFPGVIATLLFSLLLYRYSLGIVRKPSQLAAAVQEKTAALQTLLYQDDISGVPNRRWILEQTQAAIEGCKAKKASAALLLIDFDDFKDINDRMGHDVGDMILNAKAQQMMALLEQRGKLARLGGDEFAVLFEDSPTREMVQARAHQLQECLNQEMEVGDERINVHATIVVTMLPDDADNATAALQNLDITHYQTKRKHKNSIGFFSPAQREQVLSRLEMTKALKAGLSRKEFILHWQPIFNLQSGLVAGHESLVRWNHPEHGVLYPDKFIPTAEESGLILPLGYEVLRLSGEAHQDFHSRHRCQLCAETPFVAVNLSPRQLADPALVSRIRKILEQTQLNPSALKIEITETALMEHPEDALPKLRALRDLGVSIALDDFGTGYSSLWMLRRLPLNSLKIDRSFVTDIVKNRVDQEIIASVVRLARHIEIDVIAEGIENREQLQLLRDLGCDQGQGYYFAKPASPYECSEAWCGTDRDIFRSPPVSLVKS